MDGVKKNIYVVATIADQESCNDLLARLAWYFVPFLDQVDSIFIPAEASYIQQAEVVGPFDARVNGLLPSIRDQVSTLSLAKIKRKLKAADPNQSVLLLRDADLEHHVSSVIDKYRSCGAFYKVDSVNDRLEGSFYLWAGLNNFVDQVSRKAVHAERFRRLCTRIGQYEKAYVFGTGPSLGPFVQSHDFADGVTIVANSIVKNHDFLERLNPKIITAADPIFHAGCSSYAAAFRAALVEALDLTDAYFICPMRDLHIYEAYLPASLQARIIGIPFEHRRGPQTDLLTSFEVKPYPNVLTLMLLPLAATLARSVHIVGCDGRPITEDESFWSHDQKAQFVDEMENIKKIHPGFFAIDYNDYYFQHAIDLEACLTTLESNGHVCVNETHSYVPALNTRQAKFESELESPERTFVPQVVAIVDPDAKGEWGHYLAYDRSMAEAVSSAGLRAALVCRSDLSAQDSPSFDAVFGCLSVHSWVLGNKWPEVNPERIGVFAREMEKAIVALEGHYPDQDILLFMYCGSIEVVELLEYILIYHPHVRGVVNLFWAYNFDVSKLDYQARYGLIFERIQRGSSRVVATHSTPQIVSDYKRTLGLEFPVLPHPSTTFSDNDVTRLAHRESRRLDGSKPAKILFPGGARADKGYELSLRACELLAKEGSYELELRARFDSATEKAVKDKVSKLPVSINQVGEDFSPVEFVDWLDSADVMVIPYLPSAFSRRTSGLLVDAILLGVPVVVVEHTWLADEVDKGGLGVCVAPEAAALVEGVSRVIARYDLYSQQVKKAARDYNAESNWAALVQRAMISIQSGGREQRSDGDQRPLVAMDISAPQESATGPLILDEDGVAAPATSEGGVSSSYQASGRIDKKPDEALAENARLLQSLGQAQADLRLRAVELDGLRTELADARSQSDELLGELEADRSAQTNLLEELAARDVDVAEMKNQLEVAEKELDAANAERQRMLQVVRNNHLKELAARDADVAELQKQLDVAEKDLEAKESELQRTLQNVQQSVIEKEKLMESTERQASVIAAKSEEVDDLTVALDQTKQALEDEVAVRQVKLDVSEAELAHASSQLELIKGLLLPKIGGEYPFGEGPFDPKRYKQADFRILQQARVAWEVADWKKLIALEAELEGMSSFRDLVAMLVSVGYSQLGDEGEAAVLARQAVAWGISEEAAARLLLSGCLNSLASGSAILDLIETTEELFYESVAVASRGANVASVAKVRATNQKINLGLLQGAIDDMRTAAIDLGLDRQVDKSGLSVLQNQIDMVSALLTLQQKQQSSNSQTPTPKDMVTGSSASQLGQDRWVLSKTKYKTGGYFVEFGATDGILLNNTYLLEREFGWRGICIEPNPAFFKRLSVNRSCITSLDCISGKTGDTVEFILADEYGGVAEHAFADMHADKRRAFQARGETLWLKTISLDDLLTKYDAPRDIDYISIDTEGSEWEILREFPFDKWNVRLFTIEHNFMSERQDIRELMEAKGYACQEMQFDDWYYRD